MHLNPTHVLTLLFCSLCSFGGATVATGNSAPVQGYIGQGIGTSSNFMITNSYQAQYRYIQLDIDPETPPSTPSGSDGGGPTGQTSHTQYKTQICQCDGGGNASCVTAFVQDSMSQNCLKSNPDKSFCFDAWAESKNYQRCSTAQDCSCGEEPLFPSAPAEPESPEVPNTENENPESPTDPERTPEVSEEEKNPESPDEQSEEPTETNQEETPVLAENEALPSDALEAKNPTQTASGSGTTQNTGSSSSTSQNSNLISKSSDSFWGSELFLKDLLSGKNLFGKIYDPSKKTTLYFPEEKELLYGSAPKKDLENCLSCERIWLVALRVNLCLLFWFTLGLLLVSVATNILWFKKYKSCHQERTFLLTKKRIQPKK